MSATLTEFIASQDVLVQEAALALPHQFSQCTYLLGPLRQAVYLCITCSEIRGICSACSIACHTHHEQIELFPKRNFRCDCPTTAMTHPCTLHRVAEAENTLNRYGQNFKGVFCRCSRPYDPKTERETMIQCLACEDWFHESCLNLREKPSSRESSIEPHHEVDKGGAEEDHNDDSVSEASSSGLPPALISGPEYDSFVCASCVSSIQILKRWAGTEGIRMVVRDDASSPWKIIGGDSAEDTADINVDNESPTIGSKRARSPLAAMNIPGAKRSRASPISDPSTSTSCLAPPPNLIAQRIFSNRLLEHPDPEVSSLGAGDIFLIEGWRDRWCHCGSCLDSLSMYPYLVEEEDTYEPPEDPDSGLSLEELGLRALERIPRDRAIDGIHAFNEMRDNLLNFLRPFAQEGKVVNETDVRSFFDSLREATKNGRR